MEIIIQIIILVMSVVVHELFHGYAAYFLGDSTAKYAGRLTLNPIKHLDLWGSILLPLFLAVTKVGIILGWAKPVPYNPFNLKNQKWGPVVVGLAGPLANIILALLAGLGMRIIYLSGNTESVWFLFLGMVLSINILLLVFNLLPIPPLDGSKLLFAILPVSEQTKMTLEQYGFVILIFFLLFSGSLVTHLMQFVQELFLNYIVFI